MKDALETMRLDMVPPMARTLALKDRVVISDNLDSRIPPGIAYLLEKGRPTRTLSPHGMSFPYKVAFNVILFVEVGRVDCRINQKDYRIEGCAIFLASSGIVLDSLDYQAGTRFLIIAYSEAGDLIPASSRAFRIIMTATFSPLLLPVDSGRMDRHLQLLRVLQHVAEGGPDYSFKEDIVEGFSKAIAGGIARIILEKEGRDKISGRGPQLLRDFITSVQQDCKEHRDLDHYARALCVTPKYLSRIVSEQSGRTATEIIREYAIPHAKLLLSRGDLNIQQASYLMHFPNPSYFGRYFLKATGMTPRAYQRQVSAAFRR